MHTVIDMFINNCFTSLCCTYTCTPYLSLLAFYPASFVIIHYHPHPTSFFTTIYAPSAEMGFCSEEMTSDVDRGNYVWEEAKVGSSSQTQCAFGPSNEQATRECQSRNSWGEPQILMCGTQVSRQFAELNQSAVSDDNMGMELIFLHNIYPDVFD